METVLVTGGAGYIGSHAAKRLRAAGRQVVILDDLSAGHREAVLGAELVVASTGNVEVVRSVLRRTGARSVMHFAAFASVGDSVRNPVRYYHNNVGNTLTLLEAMALEGVPHFILSSTAAVFGEPVETPIPEDHPTRPINAYGETKLAVERALPHFERAHGIRWVTLRYFNAAGADPDGDLGEDHGPELHLIPLALDAVNGGPPLRVFGDDYPTPDGTCLRDYIHVTDLAEAHVLALGHLERGGPSRTFNLGNGRPFSVHEVVAEVERVTGRPVPRVVAPRREGDPAVLFASSARIQSELGWQARFADLPSIIGTAWRWRAAHPRGYAGG